jgi:hypothetical protein
MSYSGWSWTPNGRIGGALACTNAFGRVIVDTPVDVAGTHTVAGWITAPIEGGKWLYLVADAAGNGFIYAYAGELGVKSNAAGGFEGSGFDLDSLDAGWHHVAAVAADGVTRFYVDGGLVGQCSTVLDTEVGVIANDYEGGNALSSRVDDVRVYDRALGASEIAGLAGK